ncbi:MAG: A/G-specific adenine glycosylase [Bacteroidetes bacterium]|nr:A/G-specific adenine glycosylase [Bacteroidota bacterium]MDA1268378.1 A/G-specific adenine glycosylase [Bacteroidota bacterium]
MKSKVTENQFFSNTILSWYRENPRDLPWRETQDPYKIWLSEIILQQTRVAQGLPYYQAFVQTYPSVKELAEAPEKEVLRLWQGLGYYSRARNLHACAQYIWRELGGNFPNRYATLIQLKGVGSYTAAAISSFAFGEVQAVVDGNVFRVLARYFGIATNISSGKGKKEFEALANQLIPKNSPGEFNQAMMDFGSRCCAPKNPSCGECPLTASCFAFQKGLVASLPLKVNKTKVKDRTLNYLVIRCDGKLVWKKRGEGDIWTGLYDFPLLDQDSAPLQADLNQEARLFPKKYRHLLSHQRILACFWELELAPAKLLELEQWCQKKGLEVVEVGKIDALPKPKLILRYLTDREF